LLATVIGQDIEETADGRFVIAPGWHRLGSSAWSTPQARHGHKSNARGFDGYKGHVAIDPDSEVICAADVGAANAGDAAMAQALLADLAQQGVTAMTKVAAPTAPAGALPRDRFRIDPQAGTVTCPARLKVPILPARVGAGWPASAAPARSARWRPHVPAAEPAAPSPSTHTRRTSGGQTPTAGSGLAGRRARPHLVRPPHPGRPGRLPRPVRRDRMTVGRRPGGEAPSASRGYRYSARGLRPSGRR
jgi:hypothetical protein